MDPHRRVPRTVLLVLVAALVAAGSSAARGAPAVIAARGGPTLSPRAESLDQGTLPGPAAGGRQARAELSLREALQLAFDRSPVLRARREDVEVARAELIRAGTYPLNPTIDGEIAARKGTDGTLTDVGVSVTQGIEIGGQRARRVEVAESTLEESRSRLRRARRLLAARLESDFAEAIRARELRRIGQADVELAGRLLELTERRLEAGETTRMEVNLVAASLGRAEKELAVASAAHDVARSILAETAGLEPSALPGVVGGFHVGDEPLPGLDRLVDQAVGNRADLAAFRQATETARRRIRLARREVIPDLFVSGFYAAEEGNDIFGGAVGIELPIFDRNQGEIARAEADSRRASHEAAAAELEVEREVTAAWSSYRAFRRSTENLESRVIGGLEENLDLLERALDAGKLSLPEVLVFRREFIEAQREFVGISVDAWQARVLLELASGQTTVPSGGDASGDSSGSDVVPGSRTSGGSGS